MEYAHKSVQVGSQEIYYKEFGTGEPILFLHGWGGSSESFFPLWDELLQYPQFQNKRLIAIDFPGFGESLPPKIPWAVADYARLVIDFLDTMKILSVDLVSHSFGGRVSIVLLHTYPKRCERSFFIAPAGIRHEKKTRLLEFFAKGFKFFFSLPVLRSLFPFIRKIGYKIIGGHDYLHVSGVMKETFQKVVKEDLSPFLPDITQPVYVAFGKNDTYVPYTDGLYMEKTMKQAQLTIFDDGRHGIHKTHKEKIARLCSEFFS